MNGFVPSQMDLALNMHSNLGPSLSPPGDLSPYRDAAPKGATFSPTHGILLFALTGNSGYDGQARCSGEVDSMHFGADEQGTAMTPGYGETLEHTHTHSLLLAPQETRSLKMTINQTKKARPFVQRREHLLLDGVGRRGVSGGHAQQQPPPASLGSANRTSSPTNRWC